MLKLSATACLALIGTAQQIGNFVDWVSNHPILATLCCATVMIATLVPRNDIMHQHGLALQERARVAWHNACAKLSSGLRKD